MKKILFCKYISSSERETKKIAGNLAREILSSDSKVAAVLTLSGELGAGKTTFLQGFAKGLGIKEKITSPTFVLMKRFKVRGLKFFDNFYHFDFYRINNPKEVSVFKLEEIMSNHKSIVTIEWPEMVGKIIPKIAVKIKISHIADGRRAISISGSNKLRLFLPKRK